MNHKNKLGIMLGKNFAWGNHHYYSIKIWSTMNEKRASSQKTECLIAKNIERYFTTYNIIFET